MYVKHKKEMTLKLLFFYSLFVQKECFKSVLSTISKTTQPWRKLGLTYWCEIKCKVSLHSEDPQLSHQPFLLLITSLK